ncbi:VirB4 family type IV secretion system protein (plasmid) [Robbsia andropogonis]|uniref:VirB4 family type IV secretion system protein n=1 Tax=Robbsia andropogonis TaxID=28092 RepID=UPI003D202A39
MLKVTGPRRRPIQEIAPWAVAITPGLTLNKDGSVLAVYDFEGIDADSPDQSELSHGRDSLDAACKNFDHRVTAWWRISHRRVRQKMEGEFASAFDKHLDELNNRTLGSGKFFTNKLSLSLGFTPETGLSKIFDRIGYHMTTGGKSVPLALVETAKDTLLSRSAFVFDLERMRAEIKRVEGVLDAFTGGLSRLKLRRREMQNAMAHLHQCANPSVPPRRIRYPVTMLDTHLTESFVVPLAEHLKFESAHGVRYAKIIGVKEWLNFQEAALDVLNDVDAELDVCIMYRFLDAGRAASYINKVRRFYKMAAFNPWDIIKMYISKEGPKNDKGRERLADEAEEALAKLTADGQQYGFANISVVVYGDTVEEVDVATSEVIGRIGNAGFGTILERTNLFASFATTLPGQWSQQKRLQFVETPAVSDIAPIRSVPSAGELNAWLSQQAGKPVGPLTCLPTRHKTLQSIHLHDSGGNSHLLVVGPAGNGKSVMLNFLTSQTGRHQARRIRFDKDRSTRITTELAGGTFIDATGKFAGATPVNPLSLLADPNHYTYVSDWVQLLLEDDTFSLSREQARTLFAAVKTLGEGYSRELWTLSYLVTLLPHELRDRLLSWTQGQKNGHFFDNVEDGLSLSDDLSIEMGDLFLNHPVAAAMFLDYAFYRISQWMDGKTYVVIEVEECGFFFQYPRFYSRLEMWATTIRKLNGSLFLATQSLKQMERVPNFEILRENIPNIIYLPNSAARTSKHLYRDKFGLSDDQIDLISDGQPNRDYLLVTKKASRMLQVSFPKDMLAGLRSDIRAQNVMDKHLRSGDANWRQNYLAEMALEN